MMGISSPPPTFGGGTQIFVGPAKPLIPIPSLICGSINMMPLHTIEGQAAILNGVP